MPSRFCNGLCTKRASSIGVSSYTPINYSSFFYHYQAKRAARYMVSTINAIQFIPRFFIHCRAERAAKYVNSTFNDIQFFPLPSQTSRLVWWMVTKEALHSVVRGGYRLRPTVDLFFYGKQKFNFHCFQKFKINLYCLKVIVALRSRYKTYKSLDKRF